MSSSAWSALAGLLATSTFAASSSAQEPTLRVRVEVVTIDAHVHENQRPVAGLTAADFVVRDNGMEQAVHAVATTDSAHVIVALDVSGSVVGEVRERLQAAVSRLLSLLTPADRLSVVTFGDRVRVHTVAALPAEVKTEALWPLSATGSTTLHDAMVVAAQLGRADARPALVLLFTDGTDTASWSAAGTVLDALRRSSVVVVAVGAGLVDAGLTPADAWFFRAPSWLSPTPGDTLRFMHLLADTTAGEFVRVERRADLADVFAGVLQRYRQRYLLSFTPHPDNPRGWHRLEVRLREKEGTVAARPGYMVP